VCQDGKLGCSLKPREDLNASAAGRAQSAVEIIDGLDRDAALQDRGFQRGGLGAGIAGRFARLGQRLTVGLLDVLSRDSATWTACNRVFNTGHRNWA
jgi:hypothetical protein